MRQSVQICVVLEPLPLELDEPDVPDVPDEAEVLDALGAEEEADELPLVLPLRPRVAFSASALASPLGAVALVLLLESALGS